MLFLLACIWTAASFAAGRLAAALVPMAAASLAGEAVRVAMLLGGFLLLARMGIADLRPLSSVGMVQRPTARDEFGRGVALGWVIAIALVLPALLGGYLRLATVSSADAWRSLVTSLLLLLLFALLSQLLLAGLLVRLLLQLTKPATALLLVLAVGLLLSVHTGPVTLPSAVSLLIAIGIFVTGFLRTRALWLSLGIQIGWTVSQQLLFAVPSRYTPLTAGVMQNAAGPPWLPGSAFDPDGSYIAVLVLLAAWVVVLPLTRTYAWHYTYQAPEPAGFPMDVAPPPQHAAQVQAPAAPTLIQISGPASPELPKH